ncbi:MAG: hypothetical protein HF314_06180 [Ignavibacteria bacterium]|jgi:predicted nucleic acid-binding protein|nr:hypothetical protein [Ignavibacteria bacterium]MCU7515156.1 hypothetical protein [Ignavibacteria bacterium]
MSGKQPGKTILLDADVIIHFMKGDKILKLAGIFPHRLAVLDVVKDEVCKWHSRIAMFDLFVRSTKVPVIPFPTGDIEIFKEYAFLLKSFGPGESACMAYARYKKNIIASSNLKDIKEYCEHNGIKYLTTMAVLAAAVDRKIMDAKECNKFIAEVKSKGSKLPFDTIEEYMTSPEYQPFD